MKFTRVAEGIYQADGFKIIREERYDGKLSWFLWCVYKDREFIDSFTLLSAAKKCVEKAQNN